VLQKLAQKLRFLHSEFNALHKSCLHSCGEVLWDQGRLSIYHATPLNDRDST
jgi:hypothetical protein